jgi:hypothetical protein
MSIPKIRNYSLSFPTKQIKWTLQKKAETSKRVFDSEGHKKVCLIITTALRLFLSLFGLMFAGPLPRVAWVEEGEVRAALLIE